MIMKFSGPSGKLSTFFERFPFAICLAIVPSVMVTMKIKSPALGGTPGSTINYNSQGRNCRKVTYQYTPLYVKVK